ncbi:hypothetical protein ABW20_dc0103769 [Dactylellina cionopaga]|nr:hypothetical protein ABW20_dc0103769 [Dactylellina cionopaga]
MDGFGYGIDIIDLTDDFEEATAFHRQKEQERRDAVVIDDSDDEPVKPPTPVKRTPPSTKVPAPTAASKPRKPASRNNTKSSTKKHAPAVFQRWRSGQNFEESVVETPLSGREKKRRRNEAEEKELGDRIQELAASVGWSQPRRDDQRTTRKNSAATPYLYTQERLAPCDICGDKAPIFETMKLRCKHRHCNSCLQQNFQMVVNDPNAWPAKCCRPLDHDLALNVLPAEEFQKFLEVKKTKDEMSSSNCFNCQQPIPTFNIIGGSTAFCFLCESITCVHCTKAMHEGACLLDPETEKLLQIAKGKKWSKCPRCSNMVERNTGCNSMMCRCGMNFCYKCGRQMSTCSSSGGCAQINFQPDMWHEQAPHKPIKTNKQLIEDYRKRSKEGEEYVQTLREAMAEKNSKALEKQQVFSEIVSLRAKLEKKPEKKEGNPTNSNRTSVTPTMSPPKELKTPVGINGYKKAFPALMKVLETAQSQDAAPTPPTLLQKYQKSFPALMKSYEAAKIPEVTMNESPPVAQPSLYDNMMVDMQAPVKSFSIQDLNPFYNPYTALDSDPFGSFPFYTSETDLDIRDFLP